MTFNALNLHENILKAIDTLGFTEPTTVQLQAIPKILNHQDLIVMAKTGSGKTGAFSMPIIQGVDIGKKPQALILTPTRELAVQVEKELKALAQFTNIQSTVVYGQHSLNTEIEQLKKGRQIIVGTPGRVLHHMESGHLKTSDIKYLVLDEADRMLDMGFIEQMIKIIKKLPVTRNTLLFSATMPDAIQRMSRSYMNNPETIALDSDTKTVDAIKQGYYRVENNEKRTQLKRILTVYQPKSCMVFCNMRTEVDKVNDYLVRRGFLSEAIHGANTQSKRMRTIEEFKKGEIQIMVATDVAARGIHIDDLELVINYDVPQDKDNYIHRVGRTGRAGQNGQAITLVTGNDLYTFYEIEEHAGARIDEYDLPTDEEVEKRQSEMSDYWEKKREERLRKRELHKKTSVPKNTKKPTSSRSSHQKTHPQKNHTREDQQKKHHTNPSASKHKPSHPADQNKKQGHTVQEKQHEQKPQIVNSEPVVHKTEIPQETQKKKFSLKALFKKEKK
ncbi:MAG: DEAD/DEAH box helicase [Clostridia bacterium]|nr:DEAD/DEAH box helicase [Clostridia bacterium]